VCEWVNVGGGGGGVEIYMEGEWGSTEGQKDIQTQYPCRKKLRISISKEADLCLSQNDSTVYQQLVLWIRNPIDSESSWVNGYGSSKAKMAPKKRIWKLLYDLSEGLLVSSSVWLRH
jgi:hypothetical protein